MSSSSSSTTTTEQQQQNGFITTTTVSSELLVLVTPRRIYNDEEQIKTWFVSTLEDELFNCLSSKATHTVTYNPIVEQYPMLKDNIRCQHIEFDYKYQKQAAIFMHRISVYDKRGNPPEFVINLSDLPRKVKEELFDVRKNNPVEFRRIMLKSIDRLCEEVDFNYFHQSAAGLPKKWRFEE